MKTKLFGIFICMLLVGSVLPVTGTIITNDRSLASSQDGNTLYVGGNGPGNYTSIQDAINNVEYGGTVFVYDDSSPYYENLIITKSIKLIGEKRDTTVINGKNNSRSAVVKINSDTVSIQGFTIEGKDGWNNNYYGLQILSNNNSIVDNIIKNSTHGVQLGDNILGSSNDNKIKENLIISNGLAGIILDGSSSNNVMSHNVISSNEAHGIFLRGGNCKNNKIKNNSIKSNGQLGIWIRSSDGNLVKNNNIVYNKFRCIEIFRSHNNLVMENNIYSDKYISAWIEGDLSDIIIRQDNWLRDNIFEMNYWGRFRNRPEPVIVCYWLFFALFPIISIAYITHPASEPYDIEV